MYIVSRVYKVFHKFSFQKGGQTLPPPPNKKKERIIFQPFQNVYTNHIHVLHIDRVLHISYVSTEGIPSMVNTEYLLWQNYM